MKKTLLWLPLFGLVSAFVVVAVGGLSGRTRFPPKPEPNAVRQQEAPGRIAVFSGGLDERMAATICDLSGRPNPQVLLSARRARTRRTTSRTMRGRSVRRVRAWSR